MSSAKWRPRKTEIKPCIALLEHKQEDKQDREPVTGSERVHLMNTASPPPQSRHIKGKCVERNAALFVFAEIGCNAKQSDYTHSNVGSKFFWRRARPSQTLCHSTAWLPLLARRCLLGVYGNCKKYYDYDSLLNSRVTQKQNQKRDFTGRIAVKSWGEIRRNAPMLITLCMRLTRVSYGNPLQAHWISTHRLGLRSLKSVRPPPHTHPYSSLRFIKISRLSPAPAQGVTFPAPISLCGHVTP